MSQAKETQAWDRTALLWALLANVNRDPQKQATPFSPGDVHPYRTAEDYKPKQPQIGDLSGLKAMFEVTNGSRSN